MISNEYSAKIYKILKYYKQIVQKSDTKHANCSSSRVTIQLSAPYYIDWALTLYSLPLNTINSVRLPCLFGSRTELIVYGESIDIFFLPYRLLICFTFVALAGVGYFNVMLFHSVFHHVLVSMFG